MLARTNDGFWGSKLEVKTPTATAHVKGTAFSVAVDPGKEATTLKVLAGSIFFSPHAAGVGVEVRSGQVSYQPANRLPQKPVPMTIEERAALLEAFKIGQSTPVALVVGEGPERVEELFGDLLLYVDDRKPSKVYQRLAQIAEQLNVATLDGELERESRLLGQLERLAKTLEKSGCCGCAAFVRGFLLGSFRPAPAGPGAFSVGRRRISDASPGPLKPGRPGTGFSQRGEEYSEGPGALRGNPPPSSAESGSGYCPGLSDVSFPIAQAASI